MATLCKLDNWIKPGYGLVPSPDPNLSLTQTLDLTQGRVGTWPTTEQGPLIYSFVILIWLFLVERGIQMLWWPEVDGCSLL